MATVPERCAAAGDSNVFICDFSPPRGGDPALLEDARGLNADFISVAYNPGRSVRVNSALTAHWIKANIGRDTLFTVATRDMNKVATQSLLLGAALLGLQNAVVVKGDAFTEKDLERVRAVDDFTPTELIASITAMNQGVDFRGVKLRSPTNFAVGATIDLNRDMEREVVLAHRKAKAGASFFLLQAVFEPSTVKVFLECYQEGHGEALRQPLFCGVQVMAPESITFGNVPRWVMEGMASGRTGSDIAVELVRRFADQGLSYIYLVPPILKGGVRDYDAARRVLTAFGR